MGKELVQGTHCCLLMQTQLLSAGERKHCCLLLRCSYTYSAENTLLSAAAADAAIIGTQEEAARRVYSKVNLLEPCSMVRATAAVLSCAASLSAEWFARHHIAPHDTTPTISDQVMRDGMVQYLTRELHCRIEQTHTQNYTQTHSPPCCCRQKPPLPHCQRTDRYMRWCFLAYMQ